MAAKSRVAQLWEKRAKEAKEYKTDLDVDRLHSLLQCVNLIRDYPKQSALAGAVNRELDAMNTKQAEEDAKETEEQKKEMAEAVSADAKSDGDDEASHPMSGVGRAPSAPRPGVPVGR